jgi:hypothetical protein
MFVTAGFNSQGMSTPVASAGHGSRGAPDRQLLDVRRFSPQATRRYLRRTAEGRGRLAMLAVPQPHGGGGHFTHTSPKPACFRGAGG